MADYDVGAVEDADGRVAEVAGRQILLLRDGDAIRAVGAACPHAGAPLAQGLRHGGRLICPWHKAAFCIRTGVVLDPPAVDPLPSYAVRQSAGRLLLTLPAARPAPPACHGARQTCVIVGGGAAGAVAAQTLRESGFDGEVVILDREGRVPYDRTLLSKYHLSGQPGAEKSPLQPQSWWRDQGIERRTAEVVQVDARRRCITCADGNELPYDAALIATGGVPRRLDLPGAELAGVFALRRRSDAEAILARAERSTRAVIVGTGFIGMEVAASLRERGLDVTVTGPDPVPFARTLGEQVGRAFAALHERQGVRLCLGRHVTALEGHREVRAVALDSGEHLPADLVVVGAGIRPASLRIHGVTLDPDGAIPVDASLRAAEGLFAAGDVARFPLYGDGPAIRLEHWRVAQQQGRVAGLGMAGRAARYDAVPVFWTIQYLKRLDYVGHAGDWDDVVLHGDPAAPPFLAYYVRQGQVVAAAGLDRDRDTAALAELFALRRGWRPEELGDSPAAVLAGWRG